YRASSYPIARYREDPSGPSDPVAIGDITLVILEVCEFLLHRLTHRRERTIDADHPVSAHRHLTVFCLEISDRFGQIYIGATMIEMHSHVWITLGRVDDGRVERRAPDRIDAVFRIDIVRDKDWRSSRRGGMDHSAAHWYCVFEHFVSNAELLERMNPAG